MERGLPEYPQQTVNSPTIEFVNHACVLLSDGRCGLLTDPWLFGEAFHRGWALLTETPDREIARLLGKTTHIWLSHEHPDHFSIPFFQRFSAQIIERGIQVIFQKTRDRRVADYLLSRGFGVVELEAGRRHDLNDRFSVWVEPSHLYDSALIARIGNVRVFNVNDCPLNSPADLDHFVGKYGTCDVLMTQFSYAAWQGGEKDVSRRRKAARKKIETMHRQIGAFRPGVCIPFANFSRFANSMNSYLNDSVNSPAQVLAEQEKSTARLVVMAPGEAQPLNALQQSPDSLAFWRAKYAEIPAMPLMRYSNSETRESLGALFGQYQTQLFRRNNRLLMRLARDLLPFHPFLPTTVQLVDLDVSVRLDPLGSISFIPVGNGLADLGLHSSSLAFCLRFPYGLDTLYVNGCFEELSAGGLGRFAKCFGIGSLNSAGVDVAFSALGKLGVVMLLLKKLRLIQGPRGSQKTVAT